MSDFFQPPAQSAPLISVEGRVRVPWWSWFQKIAAALNSGTTTTVTLAKITGAGTNGSLTIINGIVTAYVPPT